MGTVIHLSNQIVSAPLKAVRSLPSSAVVNNYFCKNMWRKSQEHVSAFQKDQ